MGEVIDIKTKKVLEEPVVDVALENQKVCEFLDDMKKQDPGTTGAFVLLFDAKGRPSIGGFKGVKAAVMLYGLNAYMASFINENLGD